MRNTKITRRKSRGTSHTIREPFFCAYFLDDYHAGRLSEVVSVYLGTYFVVSTHEVHAQLPVLTRFRGNHTIRRWAVGAPGGGGTNMWIPKSHDTPSRNGKENEPLEITIFPCACAMIDTLQISGKPAEAFYIIME